MGTLHRITGSSAPSRRPRLIAAWVAVVLAFLTLAAVVLPTLAAQGTGDKTVELLVDRAKVRAVKVNGTPVFLGLASQVQVRYSGLLRLEVSSSEGDWRQEHELPDTERWTFKVGGTPAESELSK